MQSLAYHEQMRLLRLSHGSGAPPPEEAAPHAGWEEEAAAAAARFPQGVGEAPGSSRSDGASPDEPPSPELSDGSRAHQRGFNPFRSRDIVSPSALPLYSRGSSGELGRSSSSFAAGDLSAEEDAEEAPQEPASARGGGAARPALTPRDAMDAAEEARAFVQGLLMRSAATVEPWRNGEGSNGGGDPPTPPESDGDGESPALVPVSSNTPDEEIDRFLAGVREEVR